MFHAITGCDTTSSFLGKGKKTAWNAWSAYLEVTNAFLYFLENPVDIDIATTNYFSIIERFIVIMYDRGSEETSVNEARLNLFTKKNRPLDNLPPTQDALKQHLLRSTYQARIWIDLEPIQNIPPPTSFGWKQENLKLLPIRITLPEIAIACKNLIKCGCKTGCGKRCKCVKANLLCTELCACDTNCENNDV